MEKSSDKLLYQIALTLIPGIGDITARNILQIVEDEEVIFRSSRKSLLTIKGISTKLVDEILNPDVLKRAEAELQFVTKNNINTYFIKDEDYPHRLKDCVDAPILFYFKGHKTLEYERIISIVGTRNATNYGIDFCKNFLEELANKNPDTLIISGLAYGIDIHAHRHALKNNLPTIGVLAHGLDRIYPASHRQTAIEMIGNGGLLTDFPSNTQPDRFNFVKRNRIVAGLADAVIVVESDSKGGSLITAEIANSYCRDVFAVSGKITDKYSQGCNNLIASHKADLFQSVDYFLQQMGWDKNNSTNKNIPKQTKLFVDLIEEQQTVVNALALYTNMHVDQLASESGIPSYKLSSTLLDLEMQGIIKNLPGNSYSLV